MKSRKVAQMADLELSIMAHSLDPINDLRPWLDPFEAENHVNINLTVLNWDTAWSDILKSALYHHGPDISEIGSTWVSSLIGMNALRPFSNEELSMLGGQSAYLPTMWESGKIAGENRVWAFPWLAYTRVLFYRRDLLLKAGIDEQTAFRNHASLVQTLVRLKKSGVSNLWGVPIRQNQDTLHNISSWVWQAGGDFISSDGRRILFHHEEALDGMLSYFELHRFLVIDPDHPDESESYFGLGKTSITPSGPWMWPTEILNDPDVPPEVSANVGAAPIPGVPFVGASDLVIWKHSHNDRMAVKLLRHLTSLKIQLGYAPVSGLLPVRHDVLEKPPYSTDPIYQVMCQSLLVGRSFPNLPLWGLVENKLTAALDRVWADILDQPQIDIRATLKKYLEPLAQQLELTLSQN
jgi:multiple sugar transport system substrate-binding protein